MKGNLGIRIGLVLAMLGGAAALGRADEWPTHSIRMLVGFGPGGGTDIAARFVAQPLSGILDLSVVVENDQAPAASRRLRRSRSRRKMVLWP